MDIRNMLTTIDTHTEGGPTRIITGGVPPLPGQTLKEKMEYFRHNFDDLRKMLMFEPRGHKGMFGAVITESLDPQADLGVFFLTNSGYLSMCVHSAIGVAMACLETGIIPKPEKGKPITLDTPAGLNSLEPKYEEKRLKSITIQTNPAFVHTEKAYIDIGGKTHLKVSLVFSAVFFVLVDVKQLGIKVERDKTPELISLGVKILEAANKSFDVHHPENLDINTVELAMLYEDITERYSCNAVISRTGSLDRSPCGAGTGAKMAYLFVSDKLKLNENFVNESVYGTKFEGRVIKSVNIGSYPGAIPKISGSAFITGFHQFVLDINDPLITGL